MENKKEIDKRLLDVNWWDDPNPEIENTELFKNDVKRTLEMLKKQGLKSD